jgi:uncharacterized protein (DUF2147 family)
MNMRCTLGIILVLILTIGATSIASTQSAGSPAGIWLTEKGDARIQISPCGSAICGKIVWLRDPIDPNTGKPQVDDKNMNPKLATRPMMGLQLFIDMKPSGPGMWAGSIYNGDDGKVYASKVSLQSPTLLRVEGCVGSFCGGETWTKYGR